MQTVTSADGTSIAYEQHGEGQPLILLHGGSTRQYWKPIVPRFTDDYTVVVPDRRGHGESGDATGQDSASTRSDAHEDGGGYSLEREVEDTRAIIDAVDGDPILFGHSFGGLQAIEAARVAPVEQVVAYEPAVLVGEYREQANLVDQMQAQLDQGEHREAMKLHVREVIHGGEIGEDALDRWLAEWPPWPEYARLAEQTLRMNREIEQYRLPDTLDIDVPALMLTGTEGPSHLQDSVRAVHEALPDSRLVEFEGVSHAGPQEEPDRITAEIREFLDAETRQN